MTDLGRSARGPVVASIGTAVLQGLVQIVIAWITARVIDAAVFGGAGPEDLAPQLIALLGLFLAKAVLAALTDIAGFEAAARARATLFTRLYDHVTALGPVRLADIRSGDIATTLTDAIAAIEPYWRRWLPARASAAVLPFAILAVTVPVDWRTTLVFAGTLPLLPLFMILVGRSAERANQRQWVSLARLGGHLLDAVEGLADLAFFRATRREIAIVRRMADDYRKETMAVLRLAFLSALVLEFFATISIAITAVLVGFRLLWGGIAFADGLFLLLLAPQFYAPLRSMGVERHGRMEATAAAERIVALLDRPAPERRGTRRLADGPISLVFENVAAAYSSSGQRALDGISFEIAAGEHIAIVGPSGAGKSTLFALIAGFLEPVAGRILVNGIPLDDLDRRDMLDHIALVPQRAAFFDDTVAGNVAMGRDGDLRQALAAARADRFVDRLPAGVATPLGEQGHGISGGEGQRLMLARALFRPAPLVLLDEPTAHLDRDTERDVGEALAAMTAGRTSITIAHRLNTVKAADRILVLDRGHLVESGKHDDLVAQGGVYARLVGSLEDAPA